MTDERFCLFPFQHDAAQALRDAALAWVQRAANEGVPKYGPLPIPFLGQLRAVTGSGKTPILASVLGGIGHAVVLWTSRSSAVVDQTFKNLNGKYRELLGSGDVRVIREIPSQADWRSLIDAETGLTVWLLTTASWNEAESAGREGSVEARLSLHRPQPDWAGDTSPWDQLRTKLRRPLWIVSDESHNQSSVQLDQLSALRPLGFFMASATPVQNELFEAWQKALALDPDWFALAAAGRVPVRTREVVEAELLKTTIEVIDFNSGSEESLDGALAALRRLDDAVAEEDATISPKAIYAVEKSNPTKGSREEARPVFIWRYLTSRGVSPDEIVVYTDTRDLPEEAEKISSLSQLQPRHRHIIFNQTLQEGWDDPEAYVCYFDGVTKSFVRIRQIVGRVLRQPKAQRFASEALNTATLIINTPAESYDAVIADLRAELRLYAPEDEPSRVTIRVKTRKEPLKPISIKRKLKGKLTLPRWTLSAPDMSKAVEWLKSRGKSLWAPEFLEAPGVGRRSTMSLREESPEKTEYLDVLRSARTQNGLYFRRRLGQRNRSCLNAVHPDFISGAAFEQFSCQGSQAQAELGELVSKTADYFEERVNFEIDPDIDRATWVLDEYRPRGKELIGFDNAAHEQYSRSDFNADELLFAQALDKSGKGVWARNQVSTELGFSIPLPAKVGDSSRFYPDFLWWVDKICWAIDTTGRHLLNEKVRGKLIALEEPRVALVVRGEVTIEGESRSDDGWTTIVARRSRPPLVEHCQELSNALEALLGTQ